MLAGSISWRAIGASVLLGAFCAGLSWFGASRYAAGEASVQAKWDAQERKRAEIVAADVARQAETQRMASASYQAVRAQIDARAAQHRGAVDADLAKPPAACPGRTGDLMLPGSLGVQLNAIADDQPASSATDGSGSALPAGAGVSDR